MKDGSYRMFAKLPGLLGQDISSSKMSEPYLPLTTEKLWDESVKLWPRMVTSDGSGLLYERAMSEHHIEDYDGSALLPTMTNRDARKSADYSGRTGDGKRPSGAKGTVNVQGVLTHLKLLPTPTVKDPKDNTPEVDYERQAKKRVLPAVVMWEIAEEDWENTKNTAQQSEGGRLF